MNIVALSGAQRQHVRAAEQALDGLGGPMGLVGRVAGLGQDEMNARIPAWAWIGVGAIAGAAITYALKDRIARVIGP